MKLFSSKVWENRNFRFFWSGMTISLIGTEVTNLALPMVALILLNAGAMEVGFIKASEIIAFPVLGLFVGVLADRHNPRNIMIVADMIRFLVLSIVPVAYFFGFLNIYLLLVVAALIGIFTVFFNLSYLAYVPAVTGRKELLDGNAKLQLSQSFGQILGPVFAGWLINTIGAAFALITDAVSYLFSGIALISIKQPAKDKAAAKKEGGAKRNIWADIKEGMTFVFTHKTLWTIMFATAAANFGYSIVQPMLLVFAYKQLGFSPEKMGVILAIGSSGLILGATVSTSIAKKLGLGKCMFFSLALIGVAAILIPLAQYGFSEIILVLCWFSLSFGVPIYDINQTTLRQLLTPDELQGRTNATLRIVIMGVMPLGSILGGALATKFSLSVALIVGGASFVVSSLIVLLTHLFTIKEQPKKVEMNQAASV